jgi:GntR family transcriptional regulator, rspAB operon transcriptional repressor
MPDLDKLRDRKTNVDLVFNHLYEKIVSMDMMPGDKISEADIAAQFGVSRQPVRDAFSRLEGMDLLVIRPQRATEVKRFSLKDIAKSRFVRAAVEARVLRLAAELCDTEGAQRLETNLVRQEEAVANGDYNAFTVIDYEFHKTLCEIGKVEFAFEVILAEKAKVDRLCTMSLSAENRMPELVRDHRAIARKVIDHDPDGAVDVGMLHLSRLDETILAISSAKSEYFDP